jgi:putative tryptophan/tyrosine transport system substrate-binding protein
LRGKFRRHLRRLQRRKKPAGQLRERLSGASGAAAWPLAARAQQQIPVVGYLATNAPSPSSNIAYAAFKSGLAEMGFVDRQNVRIEFLYAEGHYDRLPKLASEFVGRHVAVIFASGSVNAALAAKAVSTSIPIVFANGSDPVASGLVASIARPGGNVTGATSRTNFMGAKRLGILHELLPQAGVFSMLVNRASAIAAAELQETQTATTSLGLKLNVLSASTQRWSRFVRQAAKVDLPMKRMIHHAETQTVHG